MHEASTRFGQMFKTTPKKASTLSEVHWIEKNPTYSAFFSIQESIKYKLAFLAVAMLYQGYVNIKLYFLTLAKRITIP